MGSFLSTSSWWEIAAVALVALVASSVVIVLVVMVVVPVGRGIGEVLSRIGGFIKREVLDVLRATACVFVAPIFGVLALGSLLCFQVKAAQRFGMALRDELLRFFVCTYRIFVGNPARAIGVEAALEGVETRLPGVLSATWGSVLSPRNSLFDGYIIEGTLASGGSGAKLYIARPDSKKLKELLREAAGHQLARATGVGFDAHDRVVIKCFTTFEDASLPQLVRESRGLEAGKRLGLILDHGFGSDRFFYVMRYVPGEHLRHVASRLHVESGESDAGGDVPSEKPGLGLTQLRSALSYACDLLETLALYHDQGLWHKDVKPDNIIIEPDDRSRPLLAASGGTGSAALHAGRARLVDIGLVSSLRSAMTLTTHGTEYYRDPEMVRQALKGAKVSDVDGTKFDIYAAGAVVYAMIEDSFPAQGVLSPFEKRCPTVVAWIVRRAMADYRQRYANAREMLADVRAVVEHPHPFAMRLVDLPSMRAQLEAGDGVGSHDSSSPEAVPRVAVLTGAAIPQNALAQAAGAETGRRATHAVPGPLGGPSLAMQGELAMGPSGGGMEPSVLPASQQELRAPAGVVPQSPTGARASGGGGQSRTGVGDLSRAEGVNSPGRVLRPQRGHRVPVRQASWVDRLCRPAFNTIGLPTRVRITNWWTGSTEVES